MVSHLSIDLKFSYTRPEDLAASMSTSTKARVLILGRIMAEKSVRAELDKVALVHNIHPKAEIDVPAVLKEAAEEHGPFDAVAVSRHFTCYH